MRVLLAEDERRISELVTEALVEVGWQVGAVSTGDGAYAAAAGLSYQVIVLDLMLPGIDGLTVLRNLRENQIRTPVLILTALSEVSERVEALDLGVDDYLVKPFAMRELIARVNALGRRAPNARPTELQVADLKMDLLRREVKRGGEKIELAVREFTLLEFLMRYPDQVFSRNNICEKAWNYRFDPGTNMVDVYINRLRRKIDDFHAVKLLHTIRGAGYMLKGGPSIELTRVASVITKDRRRSTNDRSSARTSINIGSV